MEPYTLDCDLCGAARHFAAGMDPGRCHQCGYSIWRNHDSPTHIEYWRISATIRKLIERGILAHPESNGRTTEQ